VAVVPPPELQVAHTEEGEVPYTDRPTGGGGRRSLLGVRVDPGHSIAELDARASYSYSVACLRWRSYMSSRPKPEPARIPPLTSNLTLGSRSYAHVTLVKNRA